MRAVKWRREQEEIIASKREEEIAPVIPLR